MSRVLLTGGAGFIGSHTADALLEEGHHVTLLDTLDPDVHGLDSQWPHYLQADARLVKADVRDEVVIGSLIEESDVVFHFAACTGVGQSMYQIRRYFDANVTGTATLLEALVRRPHSSQRLVVASSRAVYGEGSYRCDACGLVTPAARTRAHLEAGRWEPGCPSCGSECTAVPTAEESIPIPGSIYGVTKLTQEQACLVAGAVYGIPVVALRYFNVFGPRQSLRNPYTGVITNFVNRLRSGRAPEVYEDGYESRDFVFISDVVRANLLAMNCDRAVGRSMNVGSGERVTLHEVACTVSEAMGGPAPVITGKFRVGDVRHCFADLTTSAEVLGYRPRVGFSEGVRLLVDEIAEERVEDRSATAEDELRTWGLASKARR